MIGGYPFHIRDIRDIRGWRYSLLFPFVLGVLLAVLLAAQSAAGGGAAGSTGIAYEVRLDGALMGGGALSLQMFSRSGRFTHGWATTDENNRSVHEADVTALGAGGNRVTGVIKVVHGYVQYVYDVDAAVESEGIKGGFSCVYGATEKPETTGVVTGRIQAAVDTADAVVVDVGLGKPIVGGNEWQRQARLRISLERGQVRQVSFYPERGQVWSSVVERAEIALTNGILEGTVSAVVTGKPPIASGLHTLTLRGRVHGGGAVGTYRRTLAGQPEFGGDFAGGVELTAAGATDLRHCGVTLEMEGAVQGMERLDVHLDRRDGRFARGVGVAPRLLWKAHTADASGLEWAGDRLRGEVRVDVDPEGWGKSIWGWGYGVPRPVSCVYTVDARVEGTNAVGTFRCRASTRELRGTLSGRSEPIAAWGTRNALAAGRDYPAWRGPGGNGAADPSGHAAVTSLNEARLVWRSAEKTPDAWLWSRPVNPGNPGGYGSPVVAGGRVFVFYFLASGSYYATGTNDPCDARGKSAGYVDADDVMLCLDAGTGETLWKTVFREAGLNFNGGAGPHMTPCVEGGKVYGIGSAGRVYCLEAGTGRIVWESTLGIETDRAERIRADCRRQLVLPNTVLNCDFCSAPVVAAGVVVCNNNAGGLIGLDAGTGARVWGPVVDCITKVGSPVRWTCEGSNYVIAASERAVCVDPATGRVLWQTTNGVANEGTVAVSEDYLVTGGGGKNSTGMSCFRIGQHFVIPHWNIGRKWNCHVTSPVIYNGHAYGFGGGPAVCVELLTGKIAGTADFYSVRSCSSFVAADGRIVRPHLYNKLILYDADPKNFRQLGDLWTAPSYAECTTPAIADGRMFFRGKDCVYCYDLRARVAR